MAKMKPAMYWEWRTSCEEMMHEKTKELLASEKLQVLALQAEIARMKVESFKQQAHKQKEKSLQIQKDYDSFIKRIESELKISLKGAVIDPITFEVKQLDDKKD